MRLLMRQTQVLTGKCSLFAGHRPAQTASWHGGNGRDWRLWRSVWIPVTAVDWLACIGCTNTPRTTAPSGVGPHACTTTAINPPIAALRTTSGMNLGQLPKGFRGVGARPPFGWDWGCGVGSCAGRKAEGMAQLSHSRIHDNPHGDRPSPSACQRSCHTCGLPIPHLWGG
jgi:hypothetical protein